jgi:putative aldouronate transport system substrate-binding protein
MNRIKNVLILLLVCTISLGIFAGCGGGGKEKAETSGSSQAEKSEPTDATIVFYGENSKRMEEFSKKELHDKVLEAINVNLNVQYLPWSEYATGKTELMLSSGEKFTTYTDTAFMSKCVSKGYYADLTQAAEKYAGNLKKYCGGEDAFNIWKVNGKLYGLTFGNKPNAGENYLLITRQDILEEVGMKELKTMEDVEKFYDLAIKKHPDFIGFSRGFTTNLFNGAIASEMNVFRPNNFIMTDGNKPDDPTMYNYYASEEYRQAGEISRRWQQKGIIPSYALSNPSQSDSAFFAGKSLFALGASYRVFEFMDVVRKADPKAVFKNYFIGDISKKPLMSRGLYSTAFAVSANVEGAELDGYVKLIDLLQSNQEWIDFILYGVKGKDYNIKEDGSLEMINTDTLVDTWLPDNINFTRYKDYITKEQIETYKNWNNGSIEQKDIGFAFDMEPVKTEYAQMQAVEQEYLQPITMGFADYASHIKPALDKLKEAGMDKFLAEYEKQFSEFIKKKK